jgi:hypothetical protein
MSAETPGSGPAVLAIRRLERLARVFFRFVALVFSKLAVVIRLVEIALAERLGLLGVVELGRQLGELGLRRRVFSGRLLALELVMAGL